VKNAVNRTIPWPELMSFGFGVLRLGPNQFWSMSLHEMDAAISACTGFSMDDAPINRLTLNGMMAAYPDRQKEVSNG